jgi:hypothetical protein
MSAGVAVDASVVDHRVHSAELVDLIRQRTGLLQAGKIAHDDVGPWSVKSDGAATRWWLRAWTTTVWPSASSWAAADRPRP